MDKHETIALLQDHGITPTQQRIEIAQVLFAQPQHLSADQVLAQVNETRAVVSKATVYNTLNLFARKGLVREIIVDPTKVFYDSNTTEHHHFYNVDTGMLSDIEQGQLDMPGVPDVPDGTVPVGVDVIVRVRSESARA